MAETIEAFVRGRIRSGGGSRDEDNSSEEYEAFQGRSRADGVYEFTSMRQSRFVARTPLDANGRPLPFVRTEDGISIISVVGELVNRGAWIGASSGLVSYEGITHQLRAAAQDAGTRAILIDAESPGGEAIGAFELASFVRQCRAAKPVYAIVNGMATSAGYALASGATRIITTESGISGHIGVIMVHMDYSRMLEDAGLKPTILTEPVGGHKADSNPYEPLSDDAREIAQQRMSVFYENFLSTVSAGRGKKLTASMARATQARVYVGKEAVSAGLADDVMSFDDAIASIRYDLKRTVVQPKNGRGTGMSTEQNNIDLAGSIGLAAVEGEIGAPEAALEPTLVVDTTDEARAVRAEAAEIMAIADQARAIGVLFDAATAIANGVKPDTLRAQVLSAAAQRDAASRVFPPSGGVTNMQMKSPLLMASESERDRLNRINR
jgi:signal peptide peptidase SppA